MSNKKKLLFLEKIADKNTSRDELIFNLINVLKKNGWVTDNKLDLFYKKYKKKNEDIL